MEEDDTEPYPAILASWIGDKKEEQTRGSVVVSMPTWHAGDLGSIPGTGMLYFRCKNLVLNTRDCVSLVSLG